MGFPPPFDSDRGSAVDLTIADPPYADSKFYDLAYVSNFLSALKNIGGRKRSLKNGAIVLWFGNITALGKLLWDLHDKNQKSLHPTGILYYNMRPYTIYILYYCYTRLAVGSKRQSTGQGLL